MTRIEKRELNEKFAALSSRLVTKMVPIIKKTYEDISLVDLLMNLPISFDFKEVDLESMPEGKNGPITQKDIAIGGYITRDTERGNPDRLIVFLVFTKDIKISWDAYFEMLISDIHYHNDIAFTYIHEAMHILLRHFDYYLNKNFERIIQDIRPELDENSRIEILNHAFDYWINAYLLEEAASGSLFRRWGERPEDFPYLYDPNLSPKRLQQHEIVEKLARDAKITQTDLNDASGNTWGHLTEITINGNTSSQITLNEDHQVNHLDVPEQAEQDIQEILDSTKNNLLERTRGSDSTGAFSKLGVDYSVPIDWFKILKGSIFNIVQRYTNNYDQTWGKLKSKFRHIAPFPGSIYYDKELAAIISIDQSGSMSNDDLEKINYVVSALAKKTVFTEILLHDTRVADRHKFIGKQFKGIREFITNRVACGGTSHKEVFQIIGELKKENPKIKFVYLSFSDNYSDIEQTYDGDIFRGINSYWITTDERNTVNVPGMQISLEHGLLAT